MNVSKKKGQLGLILCLGSLIAAAVLVTACRLSSDTANAADYVAQLAAMGFEESAIEDYGTFYLVEGCLYFEKARMNKYLPLSRQARSTYLVSNPDDIKVMITSDIPTSGPDNWRTEIQQAINDWNSISNCRVNFRLVTSGTPDILIVSDLNIFPSNVLAAAEYPTSLGKPGSAIMINLDFLNIGSLPSSTKRYNMVHELGHCIGLCHTNHVAQGEQGTQITGTPATDTLSVMNGGTALNTWQGFSPYDMIAATLLYPDYCSHTAYSYSTGYQDGILTFQTGQQYYDNPHNCPNYYNGFWAGFNSQIPHY